MIDDEEALINEVLKVGSMDKELASLIRKVANYKLGG